MVRGEAGILRTDLWSLGNNARAFWKIWVMTGADYSAPVRGMRMAEGKMNPLPPPPLPRFKTLRRLYSVNGKQFENSTFQSRYLFLPFLIKADLFGLVLAVNILCVVHLFKFLRSPNWRQSISTSLFVPREAVSFVSLTPLKVSQRRKKKIFKPSYEFVYQLCLFVSRDWHINFLRFLMTCGWV